MNRLLNVATKLVTKTAAFTADPNEAAVFLCDATGGAFTVTLPAAADAKVYAGGYSTPLTFKKTDAGGNAVTIDGAGAETIDGAATKVLATLVAVTVRSNGTAWFIVGEND